MIFGNIRSLPKRWMCSVSWLPWIHHPNFGVNYDPSNTYLAGEDPIDLLKRISSRVVTMHASDRFLLEGTIEDLQKEETAATGYAKRLEPWRNRKRAE